MWLFGLLFVQDLCQERNGRSSRVSTLLITNTGSPVFGSPTWRLWPAARAGSKTITHSNYCWRCSVTHTHTPLHRPLLGAFVTFWEKDSVGDVLLKCINTDVKTEELGYLLDKLPEQVTLFVCEQELNAFRGKCSMLFHYDMISVPLVYTQVSSLLHGCFMVLKLLWILFF